MDTKLLFQRIEEFDTITLFCHVSPDADALGSQFGLKQWIVDHYPNKQVYALGEERSTKSDAFPGSDYCDDVTLQNSLAIVLDTSTSERVDDQRFLSAKHILRVDHHINAENFGQEAIVADMFGATCEILGYLMMKEEKSLSAMCAQYLYSGLIADTLRFSIPTTAPRTLEVAAYLVGFGVDVAKANADNYSTSLRLFRFENYIRSNATFLEEGFAYMIINQEDYERFGLSFNEAKDKVFVLGGVDEFKAWAIFTQKETDDEGNRIYNGSLRSKNIQINDIAERYHGGGHRFACGVKGLHDEDIKNLIQELCERIG